MKVFVTGATGFVGKAVVNELKAHGHTVSALARSEATVQALEKAGVKPVQGSLEDLEVLKAAAKDADGVIHLAFDPDFTKFAESSELEHKVVGAFVDALAGSDKPLVITSGTLSLPKGRVVDETTEYERDTPVSRRGEVNDVLFTASKEKKVRGSIVRLPIVHGPHDSGFIPRLITKAKELGHVTVVGEAKNEWSFGYLEDAATVYRLALEKGKPGSVYHAIAERVTVGEVLKVLSTKLGLPLQTKTFEQAQQDLGFYGYAITIDNPATSLITQQELDWKPTGITILKDLEQNYFN